MIVKKMLFTKLSGTSRAVLVLGLTLSAPMGSASPFCHLMWLGRFGQLLAQQPIATPSATDTVPLRLGAQLGFSPLGPGADPAMVDSSVAAYPSPTMCVLAALRTEEQATRTAAAQRLQFIERPDTLPLAPQTVRTARLCRASWSATTLHPFELPGLMRLDLLAGADEAATVDGARWEHQVPARDTIGQAERELRQLQWVIETRPRSPARLQRVHTDLVALSALGPAAFEEQIDAEDVMMHVDGVIGDLGQELASAATLRQLVVCLPSAAQRHHFIDKVFGAHFTLGQLAVLRQDDMNTSSFRTAIEHGLAQAQQDLAATDSERTVRVSIPSTFAQFIYGMQRTRNDSLVVTLHVDTVRHAIAAPYWFRRPDTTVTYPRRGVVTVLVRLPVCQGQLAATCERTYATYRRLYAQFASRGVDFIILARTAGAFGLSTLLPVQAEVDSLRAFYLDQQHLPGILSIVKTQFATLADGRQLPYQDAANPFPTIGVILRDGTTWGMDIDNSSDLALAEAFLTTHLSPHPPATSASNAG